MAQLFRFGVSLDKSLLSTFDRFIREGKYTNRSKAISDLIRQELVKDQWRGGGVVVGAVTLVYDHHKRELADKLTDIQHDYLAIIISCQHVHLGHHNCLEIIAVRGGAKEVKKLSDSLQALKGVKYVTLNMSGTGKV